MAQLKKNQPCSLFPYERTEIFSIQDASQKAGWMITSFDLPTAWLTTQGEGVKVAVLDTGCDMDHPDLIDKYTTRVPDGKRVFSAKGVVGVD